MRALLGPWTVDGRLRKTEVGRHHDAETICEPGQNKVGPGQLESHRVSEERSWGRFEEQ